MTALTLRLMGPGVLIEGDTIVRTHSARTLALLAYLVVESGRRHSRSALVELLWPDLPEASGRQSLRQSLYSIKTVAGGRLKGCLQLDPQWVLFQAPPEGAPIDIDVQRFLAAVRSDREADWRVAAALPQAPLLDGHAAVPGPALAAWLQAVRARLGALAQQNLGRLVTGHLARNEWVEASRHARALCELEPTSEAASQVLQRVLAAQGLPQAVDAEWTRLCGQLSQVLGVDPSAESVALYRALRPHAETPPPPTPINTPPRQVSAGGARDAEAMVWAGQAAERVFAFGHAADLYDRALRVMARDRALPAQRVDVLLRREAVLERLGRRAEQSALIDEALSIAEDLADPARRAVVLLRRAGVCAYQRRHDEARAAAERALHLFRDLGDAPGEAEALRELGFLHWHAEHHADALTRTREALDLHRRIGDATGEATALHNLAEIHRGLGSPGQAIPWFEQAMQLHWACGNPAGEILSLFGWAQALRQTGDAAGSTAKLQAALKLSDRSGERVMHSRVLHALSLQAAADGALDVAVDFMRRAIETDRAIGYAHALGHDLIDLSNLHLRLGEVAQARVALIEAQVWFELNDDAESLATTGARLHELDTQGALCSLSRHTRGGVKSHVSLGEGKVYCEFESPLGSLRQGVA